MPSLGCRVRSTFQILALVLVCILAAVQTSSANGNTQATYRFVGVCAPNDCTGTGVGLLTLQNYTLGTALGNANFVSFSYSSNLIPNMNITQGTLNYISGSLPASLLTQPVFAAVNIFGSGNNNAFLSDSGGYWCAGPACVSDYGNTGSGSWGLPPGTPTVPALSVPMLIGLAVMLALIGAILLKRLPKRAAS